VIHTWSCQCPRCELERYKFESSLDILQAGEEGGKLKCRWGCQCDRCKGVRQRWHDAVTMPDDVLLLPANSFVAAQMQQSRSPWSMERRAMHREVISAEEEIQRLIKVTERENKDANVIIAEQRTDGRGGVKRFEISLQLSDNLLEEYNDE
jgi:hypothetical protein